LGSSRVKAACKMSVKLTPDWKWDDPIPAYHGYNFINQGPSVVSSVLLVPDDPVEQDVVDHVDKSWEHCEDDLESLVLVKSMKAFKITFAGNWSEVWDVRHDGKEQMKDLVNVKMIFENELMNSFSQILLIRREM